MGNSKYNCRGFSLLEVLLAVAIMSVLAFLLYSSLYIAVKARKSSSQAIVPYNEVGAAFEFIRKDISCVLSPGGTLAGDFVGTDQTGTAADDCDVISMYTTSAKTSDDRSGSNIIKVEYLLEAEDTGGQDGFADNDEAAVVLKRNVTTNLLAPTTAEAATEVVARNITGMNLRYYDGDEWIDAWDSSQNDDSLPQAVEVSLTRNTGDKNVTYSKIFILDCYKPRQRQSEQSQNDESQE